MPRTPFLSRARRTWGYTRHWLRGGASGPESEVVVERGDRAVPASLFLPKHRPSGTQPPADRAWIVLHGITRPGRVHPMLLRFARAVAASGAAVLVPEVPEWVELSLAPGLTLPTVAGALTTLEEQVGIPAGRVGVMGFSFGAPQGLVAASAPSLAGRLAAVAGFGGYCDLERTVRFQFTGLHEWEGVTVRRRPDPYGRWIVAANFLSGVPGYEDTADVQDRLLRLACHAGERQIPAWDAGYDALKVSLRDELRPDRRHLFELFAPLSTVAIDHADEEGEAWARRLVAAGRRAEPLVEPCPHIKTLPPAVHLLHGRGDDLIPFTETLRLARHLGQRPLERPCHTAITGLFAHSSEHANRPSAAAARETFRFVRALSRVLASV